MLILCSPPSLCVPHTLSIVSLPLSQYPPFEFTPNRYNGNNCNFYSPLKAAPRIKQTRAREKNAIFIGVHRMHALGTIIIIINEDQWDQTSARMQRNRAPSTRRFWLQKPSKTPRPPRRRGSEIAATPASYYAWEESWWGAGGSFSEQNSGY